MMTSVQIAFAFGPAPVALFITWNNGDLFITSEISANTLEFLHQMRNTIKIDGSRIVKGPFY